MTGDSSSEEGLLSGVDSRDDCEVLSEEYESARGGAEDSDTGSSGGGAESDTGKDTGNSGGGADSDAGGGADSGGGAAVIGRVTVNIEDVDEEADGVKSKPKAKHDSPDPDNMSVSEIEL